MPSATIHFHSLIWALRPPASLCGQLSDERGALVPGARVTLAGPAGLAAAVEAAGAGTYGFRGFGHSGRGAARRDTPGIFSSGAQAGDGALNRRYNLRTSLSVRNVLNHNNPGQANQSAGAGVPGGTGFSESANNRRLELQTRFTFQAPMRFLCMVFTALLGAQTRPIGVISAIEGGVIVLKTDAGPEMRIATAAATRFLRVAPGAKDLAGATTLALQDLAAGDRILVRGEPATSIIVMSQADLGKKQAADLADWERRGISGVVAAFSTTREIGLRTAAGTVTVTLGPGALLWRYPPGSIQFSETRPARFEDLKAGDQLRARGAASADGARFTAEELVFGTFRTVAGAIAAVDVAGGMLRIADTVSKTVVAVRVVPASKLRRSGDPRPAALADLKAGDLVSAVYTAGEPTVVTLLASAAGQRPVEIGAWTLDLGGGTP